MSEFLSIAAEQMFRPSYWLTAQYAIIWPMLLSVLLGGAGFVAYFVYDRALQGWNLHSRPTPPNRLLAIAVGVGAAGALSALCWVGLAAVQPTTPDMATLLFTLGVCVAPALVSGAAVAWITAGLSARRFQPSFPA